MNAPIIQSVERLGFPWRTFDPFLFCVHHDDQYPAGNEQMGPPPAMLAGRDIGQDFTIRDGWRMYHGDVIPGFPQHPHRGFETVTLARRGYIDHSDSLGATARFGHGDASGERHGDGVAHPGSSGEPFSGIPLLERLDERTRGVWVVNTRAGRRWASCASRPACRRSSRSRR